MKTSQLLGELRDITNDLRDDLYYADTLGVCRRGQRAIDKGRETLRRLEVLAIEVEFGWCRSEASFNKEGTPC